MALDTEDLVNFQHDPLACAVALGWDGVTVERLPLVLDREDGWLHERIAPTGQLTRVVTKVDRDGFNHRWLHTVASSPPSTG